MGSHREEPLPSSKCSHVMPCITVQKNPSFASGMARECVLPKSLTNTDLLEVWQGSMRIEKPIPKNVF